MKSTNANNACQHLSIAHSNIGDVVICPDCGVVHLSLQTVSMRFDLAAFKELSKMIAQAQITIQQAQIFTQEQNSPEAPHQFH